MKRILILAAILISFLAHNGAADCGKNSDACSDRTKTRSPFLSAVAAAEKKDPSAAQAGKPPPAAVPDAATEVRKGQEPPARVFSDPAWLVFGVGLVAGLYYYLNGGKKRRKK